jgi:hypothetical protein
VSADERPPTTDAAHQGRTHMTDQTDRHTPTDETETERRR